MSKTVYVVVFEERHSDTEAILFSKPEDAIAYAKATANGWRRDGVDPEDATMSDEALAEAGWLYYECFRPDGGTLWVLPCDIDAEKP